VSDTGVGRAAGSPGSDPAVTMQMEVTELLATLLPADEAELVERVAQIVCREVADSCAIALLSEDGHTLHPLGLYDRRPWMRARLEEQPELAWRPSGGLTEGSLRSGQPILVRHADWDTMARGRPLVRNLLELLDVGSAVLAPMRSGGNKLGVVGVTRARVSPAFDDADVPFIQALADSLALALVNLRLRQRLAAGGSGGRSGRDEETVHTLTDRELEILHLIGEGLTNREVGERLHLSIRTIEWHRSNLSAKLGATQRSELIAAGRRLVPEPPSHVPRAG
jgi:DNA-binding CsgD family transcriptional regulator